MQGTAASQSSHLRPSGGDATLHRMHLKCGLTVLLFLSLPLLPQLPLLVQRLVRSGCRLIDELLHVNRTWHRHIHAHCTRCCMR